jgi:hypothetical protein
MFLKSLLAILITAAVLASNVLLKEISSSEDSQSPNEFDDSETNMGLDDGYTYKSVCMINRLPTLVDGWECQELLALGKFRNHINVTGWSYLEVETTEGTNTDVQAYSAGYLEGSENKSANLLINFFPCRSLNTANIGLPLD